MSYYTNNGAYGSPFGWRDHQEQSGYYAGMPQQQNVSAAGNPSSGDLYVTGESRRESYMHASFAHNTDSWSNYAPPDSSFTGHRGGPWQGDQYIDQTRLDGSSFGSDAAGAQMNLPMGMQIADPLLDPVAQRPTFQPYAPPSVGWTQTPGSRWQSTQWAHPEHTATRHSDQRSSMSSLGASAEVPPYQPAGPSVNAGHRGAAQTGHLHPVPTSNSPAPRSDPVPAPVTASPTRSRGEWWDPPDAPTFRCQWTCGTRCSALIAGDRRSVTSHLRDKHGEFSSDGKKIECGWAGCTAFMQRRNIPRHILACHLEVKVPCSGCGMPLSRADASRKHQLACPRVSGVMGAEEDEGVY